MANREKIRSAVLNALQNVFDPETGSTVIRMRLIQVLNFHKNGTAGNPFRPSSPLCLMTLAFVMEIMGVVKVVDVMMDQQVMIVDYTGAEA